MNISLVRAGLFGNPVLRQVSLWSRSSTKGASIPLVTKLQWSSTGR